MLLLHLPLLVLSLALPDSVYSAFWFTPKYFNLHAAALSALMILAWLIGFVLLRRSHPHSSTAPEQALDHQLLRTLFMTGFVLAVVGYLALLIAGFSRGLTLSLLFSALQGEKNVMAQLKDVYFATIPGVTTFTQFGPAAAILGTLLWKCEGWKAVRGRITILLSLAALRAIFVSERLALLEVAIPMIVLIARFASFRSGDFKRRLAFAALPIYVGMAVLVLFAASEYLRSWTNFYAQKGGQFSTFAVVRAAGYYSTAYNNSAFLLYNFDQPSVVPYFTAEWIWRFPGVNRLLGEGPDIVADRYRNYMGVLTSGVNPEFNNSGGLLLPVIDYGAFGGFVFWFLVGVASRKLFDSFRAFELPGLLLYPVLLLGILEASRLIYWTSGRFAPTFAFLALAAILLRTQARCCELPWHTMQTTNSLNSDGALG